MHLPILIKSSKIFVKLIKQFLENIQLTVIKQLTNEKTIGIAWNKNSDSCGGGGSSHNKVIVQTTKKCCCTHPSSSSTSQIKTEHFELSDKGGPDEKVCRNIQSKMASNVQQNDSSCSSSNTEDYNDTDGRRRRIFKNRAR